MDRKDSDAQEALAFLDKLFPDKKKKYFYEFQHMISSYCHGHFGEISDDDGSFGIDERCLQYTKSYNQKYCGTSKYHFMNTDSYPKEVQKLKKAYDKVSSDDTKSQEAYNKWSDASQEYDYENNNVVGKLFDIVSKTVVCPYAFTKGTGMWAVEKYGKPTAYSAAGEIFFVVAGDTVYFEVTRHF